MSAFLIHSFLPRPGLGKWGGVYKMEENMYGGGGI
jgi:hypothetical protein